MKFEICDRVKEIVNHVALLNGVSVAFAFEQMIASAIGSYVDDSKSRNPDSKYNIFEDWDYPCEFGETINDIYAKFKKIEKKNLKRFGFNVPKQTSLFEDSLPID